MDFFYFSIFINAIVEQAEWLCYEEIAIMEMSLELDDIDAELIEIGALLDAAGVESTH